MGASLETFNMTLYIRCFLLTVGGLLVAGLILFFRRGLPTGGPAWWQWACVALAVVLAITLFVVSLFGGERTVVRFGDAASASDYGIVLMVVAFPIYCVARLLGFRDEA